MEPMAEQVLAAVHGDGTPLERAAAVERAYFAFFAAHPDTPRLMLQELAAGRAIPSQAAQAMRRVHGALVEMIREGQADGSMRAGPPELMALGIIAQPVHLHLVLDPLKAATGIDMRDPATSERVIDNAVSFVRGGLAAGSPS
jgi:AcrR family transcriptional regulator